MFSKYCYSCGFTMAECVCMCERFLHYYESCLPWAMRGGFGQGSAYLSHSKPRACSRRKLALCVCEDNVCKLVTFLWGLPPPPLPDRHQNKHTITGQFGSKLAQRVYGQRVAEQKKECVVKEKETQRRNKGGAGTGLVKWRLSVLRLAWTGLIIVSRFKVTHCSPFVFLAFLACFFQRKRLLLLVRWFGGGLHFPITANARSPVALPTGYCVTCNASCCISRVWKEFVQARIIYTDPGLM